MIDMRKNKLVWAVGIVAGACALFYGIVGSPTVMKQGIERKETAQALGLKETAERLTQITKDSFAPATKEQYDKSYKENKGLFIGEKANDLYGMGKDVITGVEVENEDVIYTSTHGADKLDHTMYRVSMVLVGRTGRTPIEVYYYVDNGKIANVVVTKGGDKK